MSENKIYMAFANHVHRNFWIYVVSIFGICTGIVIGIYSVSYIGGVEKSDLVSYLNNFSSTLNSGNINHKLILIQTMKSNLSIIAAIWFLGLTLVGLPLILLIDVVKGFTLGFTACFVIGGLGPKGIWVSILGILPQNIIYIPAIIAASVVAMEFSLTILRDRSENKRRSNIWFRIAAYSFTFLIIVLIMFVGFFVEAYLTPNIIKFVASSM